MSVHRALAVAAALLCAGLAGGCGGSGDGATAEGAGARIDRPLRLVDCTDWNHSDVAQRLGTVKQLRAFAGGPTGSPAGHGAVLEDERAYDVLEKWCRNDFARGFKLYKLYTRAAAFSSLVPEQ